MSIQEEIQDLNKNFVEFTSKVDEFIDTFGESLNQIAKRMQKEPAKPSGLWKPKEDEDYWYIECDGSINSSTCFACKYDENCFSIGNCFKTQEEAEKALEHFKIRRQLKDIAARLNKGREIDWSNFDQQKLFLEYNHDAQEIFIDECFVMQNADIVYCLSTNFKDVAIAEIGEERLKNYLKEC